MKIKATAVIAAAAGVALAITAFAADAVPMTKLTPARTAEDVESVPMTALTPAQTADEAASIGIIGGADGPTAVYVASEESPAEESPVDNTAPTENSYPKIERLQALKEAIANAKTDEEAQAAFAELQELLASWDSIPSGTDKTEEVKTAEVVGPDDDGDYVLETVIELEPAEEIF